MKAKAALALKSITTDEVRAILRDNDVCTWYLSLDDYAWGSRSGLAHDEDIELDSDGDRAGVSEVYVVSIEKVGKFTREQLEAMKTLWTLQETCRKAVLCCTWINSACWPYTPLNGFGFDLIYSDLVCFRDSAWLNDDAMHGFAVFLARYKYTCDSP
ncbi:hypothetical protein GQ600_18928 [Phytophthora cactorum]|nr:hypothetical protein GQ600_18928 [Phytophthora cactorum]